MELSELTAYAEEKFHIREQHKWTDFPGFSVLADPNTGKWLALLMRQWDPETGTELQRCDIKCGRCSPAEASEPYLSAPFRMKGEKWTGVIFDRDTKPEVVFRLFDRAVYAEERRGYTIVLDNSGLKGIGDTVLPPAETRLPGPEKTGIQYLREKPEVPERIRRMRRLYKYGDGSFAAKCENFYRQGKFMEDYEEEDFKGDIPLPGREYRHYFPTYHDLDLRLLRGYFSWRSGVRRGEYRPISASLAYIYVYELLNGIGVRSPEEALKKLGEFEKGFAEAGNGDRRMLSNLRRWMTEYAVINDIPAETARGYADPELIEKDISLAVLSEPCKYTDGEIFAALCAFEGKKQEQTPVVKKDAERGKHLFAEAWRRVSESYFPDGKGFFSSCFGEKRTFPWRPLANAVYWRRNVHQDTDYVLDESRIYHCRNGVWSEERYDSLYFDRKRFHAFMHAAERLLRRYFKTGAYLRENPDELPFLPYIEAVTEADRRAEAEALRPRIEIDLSGLESIRKDALITMDSLLTEEEKQHDPSEASEAEDTSDTDLNDADQPDEDDADLPEIPYRGILEALLRGESVDEQIKKEHLMLSVVADAINEAFFDETGDNIIDCDGSIITLVEDYKDDVMQLLGGKRK